MVCFAASGNGKRQTPQIFQKLFEKLMILASRSLLGKRLGGFLERSGGLSACIGTILGVLGSSLGRPHGGFLERLGGFLTRLGAILGVLGRCLGDSGPSWAVIAASWGPLGLSWSLLGPQKVMRGVAGSPRWDATNPRLIATRGSEPWKNSSGVTTEAQGRVRGRENMPTRASRHGGGFSGPVGRSWGALGIMRPVVEHGAVGRSSSTLSSEC